MSDRRGLLHFLAIQRIFCNHPRIARDILDALPDRDIFQGDRARLREFFGGHAVLWERFRDFGGWDAVREEEKRAHKLGVRLLPICDNEYPPLLKETYDPPPLIYMKGKCLKALHSPAVAIVGSRKATAHGLRVAAEIAEGLGAEGMAVVSGMAYGIDAAAHRGALAAGGETIAVLGCGLDVNYPSGHAELSEKISETGLVISEFPLGTGPYAMNFPQRNRVISGLCIATVVIEAAKKSGSLITARFALEQARDVMAVPGLAGYPMNAGTNWLIKEGAALVETAEDVMNLISARLPANQKNEKTGHFENDMDKDSKILQLLKNREVCSVDEIINLTRTEPVRICEELTRLAVAGKIEELPGRRFCKKRGE